MHPTFSISFYISKVVLSKHLIIVVNSADVYNTLGSAYCITIEYQAPNINHIENQSFDLIKSTANREALRKPTYG